MSCSRGESCWAFGRKFKSLPSLFLTLVKYFTEESHKPQTVLQIDHWVALCLSESRKDLTLVCTLSHLPSSVITFSLYSHHLSTYAVLLQLRDIFSMFSVFRSMFTFRFYRLGSRYHETPFYPLYISSLSTLWLLPLFIPALQKPFEVCELF